VMVGAGVREGVGCEGLVGSVGWVWGGLVCGGVMVGAWVEPGCVCIEGGECSDISVCRGKKRSAKRLGSCGEGVRVCRFAGLNLFLVYYKGRS